MAQTRVVSPAPVQITIVGATWHRAGATANPVVACRQTTNYLDPGLTIQAGPLIRISDSKVAAEAQ